MSPNSATSVVTSSKNHVSCHVIKRPSQMPRQRKVQLQMSRQHTSVISEKTNWVRFSYFGSVIGQ
ncbi:hypothetical protein HanPI659440_Chr12g0446411 [Helianthus annuus]|nr:hypothetical protein HanPI659440_Chr12g0446411 [Helianthus annuus]